MSLPKHPVRSVMALTKNARSASMVGKLLSLGALATLATGALDCSSGFGSLNTKARVRVDLVDPATAGGRYARLPLKFDGSVPFVVNLAVRRADGAVDTSFNGYLRIGAKPGNVQSLSGNGVSGRSVKLENGIAENITVNLENAYGETYILAQDAGYVPVDPLSNPPPQCTDGIDNDKDGLVDFPADPGCAFANDDDEGGGSYAEGASPTLYFNLPRIADVRGVNTSGGTTAYPKQPIRVDTGFHEREDGSQVFDFNTVVTRIAANGFYVADVSDNRGFNSVFAFNFNAPPRMRVCDRMKSIGGTATEFFGFTQVSFPTWTLEEWNPKLRPCGVPEPKVLDPTDIVDATGAVQVSNLLKLSASLVRASADNGLEVRITKFFGPGHPKENPGIKDNPGLPKYLLTENETNCDLNDDGRLLFDDPAEAACSNTCSANTECTEYSNFASRSAFRLVVTDGRRTANIQANGSTASEFRPLDLRGQKLRSFTGTLTYFSGGSQFTIEARCADDVVVDLAQAPLPSDKACVFPRTFTEENPQ